MIDCPPFWTHVVRDYGYTPQEAIYAAVMRCRAPLYMLSHTMPVVMRGEMGVEIFFITFTIPFRARIAAPWP